MNLRPPVPQTGALTGLRYAPPYPLHPERHSKARRRELLLMLGSALQVKRQTRKVPANPGALLHGCKRFAAGRKIF